MATVADKPQVKCPYCGELFTKLRDNKIVSHSYPPPCRSVCPGSGEEPRGANDERPLWKDNPLQRATDMVSTARMELLIYGFAVVKEFASLSNTRSGETECPLCQKKVRYSVAECNGHCRAKCETEKCINAME